MKDRLAALAGAHTLLVESDWKGADLADLAHQQLDAYAAENPDRLRIAGEAVLLPADLATPFGLVLHELGDQCRQTRRFVESGAAKWR